MRSTAADIKTFGDVRNLILQTIVGIRDGELSTSSGMAMAANFKELNNNIQCEINSAKLALLTESKVHNFGRLRHMGTTLIGQAIDVTEPPEES